MCFLEVVVETEVQRLTTEVEAKAALDACSLEDGVSIAIAEETHVAHKGELVGQVYGKAGLQAYFECLVVIGKVAAGTIPCEATIKEEVYGAELSECVACVGSEAEDVLVSTLGHALRMRVVVAVGKFDTYSPLVAQVVAHFGSNFEARGVLVPVAPCAYLTAHVELGVHCQSRNGKSKCKK